MEEWQAWAKDVDAAELVFDSDPRRVSKGGQAQATDPLDPDTGEPVTKEPADKAPGAKKEGEPK